MEMTEQKVVIEQSVTDWNKMRAEITELWGFYSRDERECRKKYRALDRWMNLTEEGDET